MSAPRMADICLFVAAKHGVSVAELRMSADQPGASLRARTLPRQEAFYLAWHVVEEDGRRRFSTTQIGRYFGGRDHTTVLHGIRAHERRLLEVEA